MAITYISYAVEGYVQLGYTAYTITGNVAPGTLSSSNPVARIGDKCYGVCQIHGNQYGKIVTGSTTVFANAIGVARLGDNVLADCGDYGLISTGSTNTLVEGKNLARQGDNVQGTYNAVITSGSANTFN